MSPAVEKDPIRYLNVELKNKSVRVRADKICEPQKPTDRFYTLKLESEEVGRLAKSSVVGWWVEDIDGNSQ